MVLAFILLQTLSMSRLHSHAFTLIEALFAWSLWVMAVTGIAYAQMSALKSLRQSYCNDLAVIQFLNFKDMLRTIADPPLRESAYKKWHEQNKEWFTDEQDHYTCYDKKCCIDLSASTFSVSACFSRIN